MESSFATITISKSFECSVSDLFAHWTSPETRLRWEVGPESGMKYDAFDTREGGVEVVRIQKDGAEIGHMVQSILRMKKDELLCYSITGVFAEEVTTLMNVTIEFRESGTGSELQAVAQVTDLSGGDVEKKHQSGWEWMLDQFATDLSENGPVSK